MEDPKVRAQYEQALEQFVSHTKEDSQVLAIILFGSLAYSQVHDRSNINVMVVTKEGRSGYKRVIENNIPIDIGIYNINSFRRAVFGRRRIAYHQSLSHSKLLFSREGAVKDIYDNLSPYISGQDQGLSRLIYHNATIYDLKKAEKYLFIKNDLEHCFWFTIHALSELGYLMCYINGIFPPREVILEGKRLYPDFFPALYDNLINSKVTKEILEHTITEIYKFLDEHAIHSYKPILDYISENNGTATQSDINTHLQSKGLQFIEMEYLHRRKILRRTFATTRLTKKGRIEYSIPQYHFSWDLFDPAEVIPTHVGPYNVERALVQKDYQAALDSLLEKVKEDEYMLSFILCGSLAYDKIWEKSDIDIIMITRDETYKTFQGLLEKDVFFDAYIYPRDSFRKAIQSAFDGSIIHSWFSKGKIIYTTDETIHDLYEDIDKIGSRDLEKILMINYIFTRDLMNKALRALNVQEDPTYSFSFISSAIRRLAAIEVLLNRKIPLREPIEQALQLNPEFFNDIFVKTVHLPEKDKATLLNVLDKMDNYLNERLQKIAQLLLRMLEKDHEVTFIELWSKLGLNQPTPDFSDFVKSGLVREIQSPIRLAKKSSAELQQPSYTLPSTADDMLMDFDV